MYKTVSTKTNEMFVDKNSLKRYSDANEYIDFDRLQKISISHELTKGKQKMKKFIDSF